MPLFNTKSPKLSQSTLASGAHRNFMDGASYDVNDPLVRLRMVAASCFFGEPMYYHRDAADRRPVRSRGAGVLSNAELSHLNAMLGALDPREQRSMSPSQVVETAIDAALNHDAEATLEEAVRLRNEDHVRTTPQVILVRAAHHPKVRGSSLLGVYAQQILKRADEPAVALAYQLERYGRPIPNALKRAFRARLNRASAYELAKYTLSNKSAKTVDVVRLVHPKGDAVTKLVKGALSNENATWEAIISKEGSTTQSWTKAAAVMGHLALLRNLRNFLTHDVSANAFVPRLVDSAAGSQVMPFRYASAYFALAGLGGHRAIGRVKDALATCLDLSLGDMPRLSGRVVSLADNSGSAQGTTTSSMGSMKMSTIGNLSSILAARLGDEGSVGVFGDTLEWLTLRRQENVFSALARAEAMARNIGGSTENGIWLFFDRAIRERQHVDHLFVYSDMQAGHGGLYGTNAQAYANYTVRGHYIDVAKLVREYRRQVNPKVMVYLVQIAGYPDTLVPDTYDRTFILGGWGEGLLRYAARMASLAA
jgi:hypothetical protein